MAKANRTTSTPRRATAAKAEPSPKDIICRLEDQASEEAYGIGHLAELMELMGDRVGTPSNRLSSVEQSELGMRIEYWPAPSSGTPRRSTRRWARSATRQSRHGWELRREAPQPRGPGPNPAARLDRRA